MTVEELIKELNKYDKTKKVVFGEYVFGSVNGLNCYYSVPRGDIAIVDNALHENCITLILDAEPIL